MPLPFQAGVLPSAVGNADPLTEFSEGPRPELYTIFQMGSTCYARNNFSGLIDYSGSTTDTAPVINAALDYAGAFVNSAAQGAAVRLTHGLFRISNLKIGYGCALRGSGQTNTVLMSTTNNATAELGLITLKNPGTDKDVEISDLGIHGLSSAQTQALHGIHLDQSAAFGGSAGDKRHKILNCWIHDNKGSAIHAGDFADNVEVQQCRIQNDDLHGIHGEGNSHDWRIYDTEIQLAGRHGIWLQGASTWMADGLKVGNSGRLDPTNYGDDFHFDTSNNYFLASQSGHTGRDGVNITAGQNHWDGVVNEQARDMVRIAASDCDVTARHNWTGGTVGVSAVNIISGSRNRVIVPNFITAALSGVPVIGAPAGNEIKVGPADGYEVITYAASITPDPYKGATKQITLTGALTVNADGGRHHAGAKMRFMLLQGAGGGFVTTFNAQYLTNWTPSNTTGKTDSIEFIYRGSDSKWVQVATATGV
jgi:hypothetical protein